MRVLVTGSTGHLGEGMMRLLPILGIEAVGIDLQPGSYTTHVGSITDREILGDAMAGVQAVLHTASLHKPHVATHALQGFLDTNIAGTLAVLELAVAHGLKGVVFTSTTSAFGAALSPGAHEPAAWIDEVVGSIPKNIYGTTKTAAEDLCHLFARRHDLPVIVLRTSRFFPEEDDNARVRAAFTDENAKANEFLYRRVDLRDAATAHVCALERMVEIGFARFVISATTPFTRDDLPGLRSGPDAVVARRVPGYRAIYDRLGYRMFASIGRVYASDAARTRLGWAPEFDFARILQQLDTGVPIGSDLARAVGSKGYHKETFAEGPFPVETS